jgi:hypothetical protein
LLILNWEEKEKREVKREKKRGKHIDKSGCLHASIYSYRGNEMKHSHTLLTEVNPNSEIAFENFSGSAPPLFGSNLLFTSAIKSQPLFKTTISQILTTKAF